MSPVELARAEIIALLAELGDARRRLGLLADEVVRIDPGPDATADRGTLAIVAIDLHSYYTTIESLLERIMVALEGAAPTGPAAHTELLRHAQRALPSLRPAILSSAQREDLDELRRFRHFFRHAYALELRQDKLRRALDPFAGLHRRVDDDLAAFGAFLGSLLDELANRR